MSQRDSGYERKERDAYETPEWVTLAVVDHIEYGHLWEPAAGGGKMVRALKNSPSEFAVEASDIESGIDFLQTDKMMNGSDAIVTNPPYELAQEFIEHALRLGAKQIAMLLRTDFDHAASRAHLFNIPQFAKKLVLRKRIKWFEDSTGSPSFNHAWFIWDWKHSGPPILSYGP